MTTELLLINTGLNMLAKNIISRTRPFVYNSEVSLETKTTRNAKLSFYSGHVANTAALSFSHFSSYFLSLCIGGIYSNWIFWGIGAASRNGILFKGSNYLDQITKIGKVVMDKTGTLTKGIFEVQQVVFDEYGKAGFVDMVAALEANSTHPIAQAIVKYSGETYKEVSVSDIEEIPGHGLKGRVNNNEVLAGNGKLLDKFNVSFDKQLNMLTDTTVLVATNGKFAGYITIADTLNDDAVRAITALHHQNIREVVMLSGDKQAVVDKIAKQLGLDKAFGDLLPEDKVSKLKAAGKKIVFVGDGINDAPVIVMSDVGIAMGGLGSDAAIETADVVIQTDHPSKIATAIKIGKETKRIVWQNIVLLLGVGALATMWEAVFADVGVALLAILNGVRIQKMNFSD